MFSVGLNYILEQVDLISYLGVILNNDLKWSKHVTSISGKASKVLRGI